MIIRIVWSRSAENRLDEIFEYYAKKASKRTAKKITQGIIKKSISLRESVWIGQKESIILNKDYRYLVFKMYKIIYSVDLQNEKIFIHDVFDCRQNPEKLENLPE